jgi:HEAT repeat protein
MKKARLHSGEKIRAHLAKLGEWNEKARSRAREEIIRLGPVAVPALIKTLSSKKPLIRWESAEILRVLRDDRAARALVHALTDSQHQVRWVAAEALVELGRSCLGSLYDALVNDGGSADLRSGARFVLYELKRRQVLREADLLVYEVLREIETPGTSVVAVFHALQFLDSARGADAQAATPRTLHYEQPGPSA